MKRPWALPLVPLYAAGSALRWAGVKPKRLTWPVVSVGSLSAGGAGKTPFVIALARLMRERGIWVDVLSRGYGRIEPKPAWVKVNGNAAQYGDEPLLIAREAGAPVYVAAKRIEAGLLAEGLGSQVAVHLLDDGFQHRQLYRDVDIVLVSSADLQDWLLPAGNRREPLQALRRASVLAAPLEDNSAVERLLGMGLKQPIWRYRREMVLPKVDEQVVAFCGIARPEQFFVGLRGAGVSVAATMAFPDHSRFNDKDIVRLRALGQLSGAKAFVTTAKDQVRVAEMAAGLGLPLLVAGLRVVFEDEAEVESWAREVASIPFRKGDSGYTRRVIRFN